MEMSLPDWARERGVPYATAHRWFRQGTMPQGVTARQEHPFGTIRVNVDPLGGVDADELLRRINVDALVERMRACGYRIVWDPDRDERLTGHDSDP